MKRSKNIFNSPIMHQSLLEEEGVREFRIGTKNVDSNWLVGLEPHQYRRYIVSSLKLSDLQKELDDLREGPDTKQSNIFKIGKMKKKIDHLELLEVIDDEKPLQKSLAKNEPPDTSDLIVQKKSSGFFTSFLQRKCLIEDKNLLISSHKDEKDKWITVRMDNYTLQLQQKENPLNKEQFKEFLWINQFKKRILMWGEDQKSYCIYGQEQNLKKFQRFFQVEHIQVKQLNVFKLLDTQFQQKIITVFGNKVRFYDHNIKIRKAEKDAQMLTVQAFEKTYNILAEKEGKQKDFKQKSKESEHSSQIGHLSDISQSGILENNLENNKTNQKAQTSGVNLLEKTTILKSKTQKEKKSDSQVFRLKVKSSTVFYNEIQDPVEFDEKEGGYSVGDFKLNLREDVGMSQVDEQSEIHSGKSYRLDPKKRITRMTLQNVLDNSQRFNINIYEVSSNIVGEDNAKQNDVNISSSKHHSSGSLEEVDLPEDNEEQLKRYNSLRLSHISQLNAYIEQNQRKKSDGDSMIDYFQLQKARPSEQQESRSISSGKDRNNLPMNKLDKQNFLIKNFKKKKINQVDIVKKIRPGSTHFAVSEIQMMMPYHSSELNFQILQLDPELEMQKKLVVCGKFQGRLTQKTVNGQKYMLYTCEEGLHFTFSKDSSFFVFVLQEDSKCHYIHFQMNPKPKYQKNCSQLLKAPLDKDGYPFAICLILYASPQPIVLKKPLSTIQFMKRYLSEGENYDFKLDFIDDKRRLHEVKKQWNKIHSRHALLTGDAEALAKSIYLGLNDSIFKDLKAKVKYNEKKLFSFTENQSRMIEDNVLTSLLELKSFLKPSLMVKELSDAIFNFQLRQRLEQVYVYFLNRYGSVRNLAIIFIKVILDKLEPILLMCRREEEVQAIIALYAEVQYEIDQLFMEVSKHFKK